MKPGDILFDEELLFVALDNGVLSEKCADEIALDVVLNFDMRVVVVDSDAEDPQYKLRQIPLSVELQSDVNLANMVFCAPTMGYKARSEAFKDLAEWFEAEANLAAWRAKIMRLASANC